MVFSSLIFIFAFLPLVLILSLITQKWISIQNVVLFLASLLFYSWGEPKYICLFVCTVFINWLIPLFMGKHSVPVQLRRGTGVITIGIDIFILFWFKYAGWIGSIFSIRMTEIALPIGISFYTFQAIAYVADVMLMDKYEVEKNPINVGLYISFFPQLIAGPIVRYEEMKDQLINHRMSMDAIESGSFRFITGFCKKVLLADSMAVIVNKAFEELTLASSFAWLAAIAYTFQIYMDFSGYSDMAIGLGLMFGIKIPENFNQPYKAKYIRDFWRRWHITLSIWFRDYVYIPLGGSRKNKLRTVFNIAMVWILTGFWHGANWTFVLWGSLYGMLVVIEKLVCIDEKLKMGGVLFQIGYRAFTLFAIMMLWVLFRSNDIYAAGKYIRVMFRFSTDRVDETILYLSEFKWAFISCLGISFFPYDRIKERKFFLWPVLLMGFIVAVSYLVKGTFSPFLYFNF